MNIESAKVHLCRSWLAFGELKLIQLLQGVEFFHIFFYVSTSAKC